MDSLDVTYTIKPVSAIAVISSNVLTDNGIYRIKYKDKTFVSDCKEVKFRSNTISQLISDIDESEYEEIRIIATYK